MTGLPSTAVRRKRCGWTRCGACCAAARASTPPLRPRTTSPSRPSQPPAMWTAQGDSPGEAESGTGMANERPLPLPFAGMAGFDGDLGFAHVLADAADDITMRRFRSLDLRVEAKPDQTPVSDADLAVEESLRNVLSRARPRDAMLGEEYGRTGSGVRCWVIDPIDGTKNFVRGVPVWATLIGLMDEDEVIAGVVTAPALGRRWWAARDGGAWTGRSMTKASACRVSQVSSLSDASLSFSGLSSWERAGRLPELLGLSRKVWRTRAYGDFWSHVLVAEGAIDISAENEATLWDLAALQIIVEEAGGAFTDLAGVPRPDRGSAVCTNGLLHQEVLSLLADPDE